MHRRMRQGDKALGLLVRMAEGGYLVPNNQHMRLALEACVKSISPVQTWRVFTRLWQHGALSLRALLLNLCGSKCRSATGDGRL